MKAEDAFVDKYKLEAEVERDVTSYLRSAVLDMEIVDDVHFGLVISTLALRPVGLTLSDRFVKALILDALDPTEVQQNWWKRGDDGLYALAVALCDLPRAMEIVATLLQEPAYAPELTPESMAKLILDLENMLSAYYFKVGLGLSREDLRAIVYQEEIVLDDDAMVRLQGSVFTNSLSNFDQVKNLGPKRRFVPEASLVLLAQVTIRGDTGHSTGMLRDFMQKLRTTNKGDTLEWCLDWWLRLRWSVVAGQKSFSLGKLLGLTTTNSRGTKLELLCATTFGADQRKPREIDLPSSYADKKGFLAKLAMTTLVEDELVFLVPAPRECFDAGVAVRGKDGVVVVALDAKSSDDSSARKTGRKIRTRQANRFLGFADELRQMGSQVQAGSLGEAWTCERVTFIYVSSSSGETTESQTSIVLKGEETKSFLGPLWYFYRAVREAGSPKVVQQCIMERHRDLHFSFVFCSIHLKKDWKLS
eukprot:2883891-Amphidinium_carterae.1